MDVLTISHVSKTFGKHKVIDDLSFSVPRHCIFGFIGENGAGKTTTMKMILGLLKMDSGTIFVNGRQAVYGGTETNREIGYLPDVPEFYGFMTPLEYLELCGAVAGLNRRDAAARAAEMLELVGLPRNTKRIHGFSRGMKQRLGIAQALLSEPELLICDEPTSALDPLGRREILEILQRMKAHTTVLFSTHILADVERICDHAAFLHQGRLMLQGTLEELKSLRRGSGYEIEFCRPEDAAVYAAAFPGGKQTGRLQFEYEKKTEQDMRNAMAFLGSRQIVVQRFEMTEPSLEDLFMEVVKR